VRRSLEEPGSGYVSDTNFEQKIIIPLVASKKSFGETLGNVNPAPAPGGIEYWSVRVARGVIVVIIIYIDTQTRRTYPFDIAGSLAYEKVIGAGCADCLGY
jgi:hypothetical protein